MEQLYIGINGGGTRTSLVVVDRDLNVLARAQSGPSNHFNVGVERARATLQTALTELLQSAGRTLNAVTAIGAGIAGIDRPADKDVFREIFAAVTGEIPLILENDGLVALLAGVGQPFGVITISGTGSITIGVDHSGTQLRAGGWGWLMDEGSGYATGRAVLVATADAHDGTGTHTTLTDRVLARLDLPDPTALIGWMYAPERNPNEIAALAAEAVALAEQDVVATSILVRGADALALNVEAVVKRLDFGEEPIPIVMSGGLFDNCGLLRDRFVQTVQTRVPNVRPMRATREAALGAAMLAIRHAHPGMVFSSGGEAHPISDRRSTEQRNRLTMTISRQPTLYLLSLMNLEDSRISAVIAPLLPALAEFVDLAAAKFRIGGRLIMLGAGSSGRYAVLDAVECEPTFSAGPDVVMGILAGGYDALMHSVEGAEDDSVEGEAQITTRNVSANDIVVGVAASGSTPFVVGALGEAKRRGALTAAIYNVFGGRIGTLVDFPFAAPVGAEIIMGSTRLRSGTAQKMLLNMVSTAIMVRAGHTFDNLMTDMKSSNIKLSKRAVVIVAEATGLLLSQAESLLNEAGGEMKTAIVASRLGIDITEARVRLAAANGDLNQLIMSTTLTS